MVNGEFDDNEDWQVCLFFIIKARDGYLNLPRVEG